MRHITLQNRRHLLLIILPLFGLGTPIIEANIILFEGFETDGLDTRYTATGLFSDGSDDYFTRTDGNTEASGIPEFTDFGGTYFWAAEDIDAAENTSGIALLNFTGIDPGSFPEVQISIDMGAGSNSAFDTIDDFVIIEYRFDTGPWETALAFQNNGQTFNGPLLQDTDFDSIGDGIELGLSFQSIASAHLPVTGSLMDIRIDTLMTSGSEEIGFDNIQVIGVPEPNTTAIILSLASMAMLLKRRFLPQRED